MNTIGNLEHLVRHAYNNGFGEGMKEHTSQRGGRPWHEAQPYYHALISKIKESAEASEARVRALEEALKELNARMDEFWNGARDDQQVKRINAAQQKAFAALGASNG